MRALGVARVKPVAESHIVRLESGQGLPRQCDKLQRTRTVGTGESGWVESRSLGATPRRGQEHRARVRFGGPPDLPGGVRSSCRSAPWRKSTVLPFCRRDAGAGAGGVNRAGGVHLRTVGRLPRGLGWDSMKFTSRVRGAWQRVAAVPRDALPRCSGPARVRGPPINAGRSAGPPVAALTFQPTRRSSVGGGRGTSAQLQAAARWRGRLKKREQAHFRHRARTQTEPTSHEGDRS